MTGMRARAACGALLLVAIVAMNRAQVLAQQEGSDTRVGLIADEQAKKAQVAKPYEPSKAERVVSIIEDKFLYGGLKWHPFFDSAYAGGGFTLGAGYARYVSSYNIIDARGSITFSGYKRIETEFRAPRLFDRRARLSLLGGWREATQVGFFGLGTSNTSKDDRANYSFRNPYASASIEVRPTRNLFLVGAGVELTQWEQRPGSGAFPSVEEVYTPATLPGLEARPTYVHTSGVIGLDWRDAEGYSTRGGAYTITLHDWAERDDNFSFQQIDYEAVQHVPLLRKTWVLSFRGRVQTTFTDEGDVVPFFMLPAVGGGSSLRGFSSWRFRDRNTVLLSAEWRALVNRFFDLALFYDAGKAVARTRDLDLNGLKDDVGIGFRFHGPMATPLRIEFAKSNEGLVIVFAAHAAF